MSRKWQFYLAEVFVKPYRIVVGCAVSVIVALFCLYAFEPMPLKAAADTPSPSQVIYLDQGWSQADRDTFYWISQGTTILPYDIYLNLEVADSQELFRSDANTIRYGLIPDAPNPQSNPDGLPIGVTKTVTPEGRWKGVAVGINCALCHETELNYKGKRVRIDGGVGNHLDIQSYIYALDDALQATLRDSAKFDRLASKLGGASSDANNELHKRLEGAAEHVHYYSSRILVTPNHWGPGRIDALNLIANRELTVEAQVPENWFPPLAPVKPPFLWNAPQGTWTQWSGTVKDPILRNIGETIGVYMSMDLTSKTPEQGLSDSNSRPLNLEKIEDLLDHLAPPKWPEEVFGKIDRTKAAAGKELFSTRCAPCHNSYPYTWTALNKYGKRFLEVGIVPQQYVGTDPMQFEDFLPYVLTAQLAPYLPPPFHGEALAPTVVAKVVATKAVQETALKKLDLTPDEAVKIHGYREDPFERPQERSYKAAPRDGVWATPPYLHNGSVPNLYEMLIPAKERTKKFYVGQDFDPVKVGVDTTGSSGKFLMDTSLVGNSNAGHSFENGPLGNGVIGPLLTDDQRWALVEYLKSIPDQAGRVTPFGGPADARTGNVKWPGAPGK